MAKRSKRKRRGPKPPREKAAPPKGTQEDAELRANLLEEQHAPVRSVAELRRLLEPSIDTDPARFLRADQPNPPIVVRHQAKRLFGVED